MYLDLLKMASFWIQFQMLVLISTLLLEVLSENNKLARPRAAFTHNVIARDDSGKVTRC